MDNCSWSVSTDVLPRWPWSYPRFLADRTEPFYVHYRVNAGYIPAKHWVHDPVQGGGRIIGEALPLRGFHHLPRRCCAGFSVTAHALPDAGKYRGDNVSMTFTFPDGSIGVVDYLANGDKSFPKERVEVFCGEQVAVLDDFRIAGDGQRREEVGEAIRPG